MEIKIRIRVFIFLLFIIPFALRAQLDRIKPGMTKKDFLDEFPQAKPDAEFLNHWFEIEDTLANVHGTAIYQMENDTVRSFQFQSGNHAGPSPEFPKADSTELSNILKSARIVCKRNIVLFGNPTKMIVNSFMTPDTAWTTDIFYAEWETGDHDVSMEISREGKKIDLPRENREMNANYDAHKEKPTSANYTFLVTAKGKNKQLEKKYCVENTSAELKVNRPALKDDIEKEIIPGKMIYSFTDSLKNREGNWNFVFKNEQLDQFSYALYAGTLYAGPDDDVLIPRAKELEAEAEKNYGKPDSVITNPSPFGRKDVNTNCWWCDFPRYEAYWHYGNKKMNLKLTEVVKGKEPEHYLLEVNFNKPED
ncbi:MAG: hypothetical protein HY064_00480 [Bacteroidetes bacterium]|nr:hypothetical protein [Bacteroidota bacterium]